jgi:dATP pyrophosphohydrolase
MTAAPGPRQVGKRPESVLVILYSPHGRVLLLRRHIPQDYWQSVTGSLKAGERPYDAAQREISEETGFEVGAALKNHQRCYRFPIHPAWRSRYPADVRDNIEHVFSAEVAEQPVRLNSREHRDYAWLPRHEAAMQASSSTNREAILDCVPARPGRLKTL